MREARAHSSGAPGAAQYDTRRWAVCGVAPKKNDWLVYFRASQGCAQGV